MKDGHIQVLLRNLPGVGVTLREGKKSLKTWKLKNPKESFYVQDTLTVALPKLADGDYTVEAVNGKLSDQTVADRPFMWPTTRAVSPFPR